MSLVQLDKQGHIGILTIDRPEALNALNRKVLSDLDGAISAVEQDSEICVVLLTGRSFAAGADIGEMRHLSTIEEKRFTLFGVNVFL